MSRFINVIVPVYNSEKTIKRCIDSILAQSFDDFDLLLIDDGSTDSSGMICDEYAQKDTRIRVFHKQNGGVSSARNFGLSKANGEWVTFVDSDDWVKEGFLQNMASHIGNDVDLVISYANKYCKEEVIKTKDYADKLIHTAGYSELFTKYDLKENSECWAKLYKMDVIKKNGIYFDEKIAFGEDSIFVYAFVSYSQNVAIAGRKYYSCQDTPLSLSKKKYGADIEYLGYNQIYNSIENLIKRKNINDTNALHTLKSHEAFYVLRVLESLYTSRIDKKKRMSFVKSLDLSVLRFALRNTLRAKIMDFLLLHKFIHLYDFLRTNMKRSVKTI